MKILVVTDLYPISQDEKKTPKTIYKFVRGWKNLGHEINVIKPNFLFNSFLRGKPYYKSGIYGDAENINYLMPFCGKIRNKIKTNLNADIIVAHMPSGLIFANKLGLNIPLVAAVHVSDLEVLTNPIYSIYFKDEMIKAYKNASKIACRSYVLKDKFLKLFPEFKDKTFVAYSGIDSETIVKREWTNDRNIKILTCANLIKRKNVDKVIKACEKLDNVELIIIGDGKEMRKLKQLAKSRLTPNLSPAGRGEKVVFLGQLEHNSVLEEMKKSDIFILPSENETFGMVYLEAMASGCITVGLKNDGIDGIVKDGENGYLCTLDNITEVIERIINSTNQNEILENSCQTILNYTQEKACLNYIRNIQ